MLLHIHQGGTVVAYCGLRLEAVHAPYVLGWPDADRATCHTCIAVFGGAR